MGVIDASGLRGSRQGALELMMRNLKLLDAMFGEAADKAAHLMR
jgi:hypothetical protein